MFWSSAPQSADEHQGRRDPSPENAGEDPRSQEADVALRCRSTCGAGCPSPQVNRQPPSDRHALEQMLGISTRSTAIQDAGTVARSAVGLSRQPSRERAVTVSTDNRRIIIRVRLDVGGCRGPSWFQQQGARLGRWYCLYRGGKFVPTTAGKHCSD